MALPVHGSTHLIPDDYTHLSTLRILGPYICLSFGFQSPAARRGFGGRRIGGDVRGNAGEDLYRLKCRPGAVMCVSVDAARRRLLPRAGAAASVFHEDWGRPCDAQMAERRRHRGGLGFLGRGHLFSSYGDRTFAAAGPRLWNFLPVQLRNPDNSYRRVGTFS